MNQKNPNRYLLFLIGFLLWFPGVSFLSLANKGFQPLYFLCSLIIALVFVTGKKIALNKKFLLLLIVLFISLIISFVIKPGSSSAFNFIHAVFMLCVIIAFYLLLVTYGFEAFLKGYYCGFLISFAIGVFQFSFPQFSPNLINNISFGLVRSNIGRTYGFTPEPSIFASNVLPLVGIYFYSFLRNLIYKLNNKKTIVNLFLTILSLVLTSSMSILFVLPIYLFLIVVIDRELRNYFLNISRIKTSLLFKIIIILILLIPFIILGYNNLKVRFENTDATGSYNIRAKTMELAINGFLRRPLLGNGLGSANNMIEEAEEFKSEMFIEKKGVDSWFLRTLYEQGILGIISIILLLYICYKKIFSKRFSYLNTNNSAHPIFFFCLGIFLAFTFIVGYRDLYSCWLNYGILGFLFDLSIFPKKKTLASSNPV